MKDRVKDTGWMGMKMGEKKNGREPHQRVWEKRRVEESHTGGSGRKEDKKKNGEEPE